jgi:hypothetical protein
VRRLVPQGGTPRRKARLVPEEREHVHAWYLGTVRDIGLRRVQNCAKLCALPACHMDPRIIYITNSANGFQTQLFLSLCVVHLLLFLLRYCRAYIEYLERFFRYLVAFVSPNTVPLDRALYEITAGLFDVAGFTRNGLRSFLGEVASELRCVACQRERSPLAAL